MRKKDKEREKKTAVGSDYTAGLLLICVPAVQSAHSVRAVCLASTLVWAGRGCLSSRWDPTRCYLTADRSEGAERKGGVGAGGGTQDVQNTFRSNRNRRQPFGDFKNDMMKCLETAL